MKCKIVFDGGFSARGEIKYDDVGFTVLYNLEGDECELLYGAGTLSQTRGGDTPLHMTFKEGGDSVCTVGDGELSGTIPIRCNELTVGRDLKGVAIFLDYILGEERKQLSINISYDEVNQ